MKKVGLLLIIAFILYLIGQLVWALMIVSNNELFGSEFLDEIITHHIYTLSGFFGLMAGITLYKLN